MSFLDKLFEWLSKMAPSETMTAADMKKAWLGTLPDDSLCPHCGESLPEFPDLAGPE